MKIAWRGTVEPIVASGSTVIAGLLVLLLSDLSGNRGLGPVGAVGIASAMFAVLTLLPALLVVFGRWIFWPKIPKFDHEDEKLSGIWSKVANLVDRRPRQLVAITGIALLAMVAFVPTLKANGLAQTEAFTTKSDSVVGLEKLGKHFPSGEGSPVEILVNQSDAKAVSDAISKIAEVASVVPLTKSDPVTKRPTTEIKVVDGKVLLNATLKVTADSQEGRNSIPKIREAAKSVSKDAMIGGQSAIFYDTDESSLVAAAVLLFTVVLSFAATLGVCALVFNHIFKFAGADTSFPLFTFVFLVALGIDYNIFLMTRVREESKRIGTRAGVLKGVTVTGGVITSAGVVLASTFGVLGLLPLVFLAELGFAVAFGVLLDTIVVRSLLVPSIVRLLGPKIWWPSELARGKH
jgi:RND superfamily putative drug exporter